MSRILMKITKNLYMFMIFLFLYAPIAVLIIFSFNESKSRGTWGGFSLKWYKLLFEDAAIIDAVTTTITIAILAAIISSIIGTLAALAIDSYRGPVKALIMNITYLPVLNPDIVTGVSLLLLYMFVGNFFELKPGYLTLLLSHITFCIPYVILSVLPKLKQLNKNVFEAALDLGATHQQALRKVILPEIMPGVVTGFILALTLSIDDFVISFFTTGPGVSTLSITIYSMARRGIKPEINALSTIMFVVVLTLLLIVNLRSAPPKRKQPVRR